MIVTLSVLAFIAGAIILVYLLMLIMTHYEGEDAGANEHEYCNEYRKPFFPISYERGYRAGVKKRTRGEAPADYLERNKRRYGRD